MIAKTIAVIYIVGVFLALVMSTALPIEHASAGVKLLLRVLLAILWPIWFVKGLML